MLAATLSAGMLAGTSALAQSVFHRGNGAEPETLDVHKMPDVVGMNIALDLFMGLMTYDAKGEVVKGLAESWTVSEDGKVYTFKLRRDAKWSDGSPITAEDVAFSWLRTLDPKTKSDYAYFMWPLENGEDFSTGKLTDASKVGVKAIDSHTVQATLRSPTAYFIQMLAHPSTYPVSKKNVEANGDDWVKAGKMVSSGAYTLAEHVPNGHVKVVKNPNFYDAASVKVDTVMFHVTENKEQELQRYRAGELHVTESLPSTQVALVRKNYPDEVRVAPYYGTYYYAFNTTKAPWKDNPKLRAALSLTIDRDFIAEKILGTGETPAYTFTPPNTANYKNPTVSWAKMTQKERDDLAKKLFAEAGYDVKKPLQVEIFYNTSENHKRIAVAMAGMWKEKLGIEATLTNQEWKVFLKSRDSKDYSGVARGSWIGDYNDANNFVELFRSDLGNNNISGFASPKLDELVKASTAEKDPAKRAALLAEAELLAIENHAVAPIYFYTSKRMVSKKVKGWEDNIMDWHASRFVTVSN